MHTSRSNAQLSGLSRYFDGTSCKRGHCSERYTSSGACVECMRLHNAPSDQKRRWARESYAKNIETRRARQRADIARSYTLGGVSWVNGMTSSAQRRAKQAGVPFDRAAVREFLKKPPSFCPVFGRPFIVGGGQQSEDSATLDRIVPSLGYVRGNIALISRRANTIKSDATADELFSVATWLRSFQR